MSNPTVRLRNTADRLDRPSTYATGKFKRRRTNPRSSDAVNDTSNDNNNGEDQRARSPSPQPIEEKLKTATTLYVGNLSFYTTEEQLHELFSKCGEIKRIVMGLDRFQKTPCGFCFVEYYTHSDALDCLKYVGGTKLDERIVRADLDEGFVDGRQYGRGKSGGQVRDEYRDEFDPGRGGYGRQYKDEYDDDYR